MVAAEKFDEARNDSAFDNSRDGWILLFGKQLSEFGCCVELELYIVGEYTSYHFLRELYCNRD
jgi:hypothetical protein